MDEAWWLSCTDPAAMLRLVTENPDHANINCVSDRKLRLFACACCRQVWHLLTDERSRGAVEVAERYADEGEAVAKQMAKVWLYLDMESPYDSAWLLAYLACSPPDIFIRHLLEHAPRVAQIIPPDRQAAFLCDIIGNPFRPVQFRKLPLDWIGKQFLDDEGTVTALNPAWLTPQALAIAQRAYDDRDFAALPVLADAIEEAGSDNTDLLTHLRSPDPHVRGCWVLDLLLNLE